MDQSMPHGRAKLQPLPLEEITALESRIANVPIFTILGLRDVTFLRGICRAVAPRRREYDGIFETFHGGLLITIADSTDRKSTRLNSSHTVISYAVLCLKKKKSLMRVATAEPHAYTRGTL